LAAFKDDEQGCTFFTLEKGLSFFDAGADSILWMMRLDGERLRLGPRSYTDLAAFVEEMDQLDQTSGSAEADFQLP
jgi:hypothetical protein